MSVDTLDDVVVWRSADAERANVIANDPSVLPGVSLGLPSVDLSTLIANPRNIFMLGEHGGAIFVWSGPGIYDAHDFFLPSGRGAWAKAASKLMLNSMFDQWGAEMIWAQTPVENRACRMFNRMLGFKSEGREAAILIPGHAPREVEIFVMRKGDRCQ